MSKRRFASDNRFYISALWNKDLRTHYKKLTTPEVNNLVEILQNPTASPESKTQARERLILSVLALAHAVARNGGYGLDREDAVAVANLEAVKAVDRAVKVYDPKKPEYGLHAYVRKAIQQALLTAHREHSNLVRIPHSRLDDKHMVQKARKKLNGNASVEAVAKESGLPVNVVLRADAVDLRPIVSLSAPLVGTKKQDDEPLTYEDVIPDLKCQSPEEIVGTEEGRETIRKILMRHLTDNQYQVLIRLLGLVSKEPMTYPEIALELNASWFACAGRAQVAYRKLRKVEGLKELLQLLASPYRLSGKTPVQPPAREDERPRSQRNPGCHKLTADQVREIRKELAAGVKTSTLAKRYGLNDSTIRRIKDRTTWRDVE